MTAPTKAELREALERAMRILEDDPSRPSFDWDAIARTLRAFLDSGLRDDERETVRKVRDEIRLVGEFGPSPETCEEWAAALAPIAEGR